MAGWGVLGQVSEGQLLEAMGRLGAQGRMRQICHSLETDRPHIGSASFTQWLSIQCHRRADDLHGFAQRGLARQLAAAGVGLAAAHVQGILPGTMVARPCSKRAMLRASTGSATVAL